MSEQSTDFENTGKKLLCKSSNGKDVFVDADNTNIRLHIIENPDLIDLVKEAVEYSELDGEKVALEVDLGRIVGFTSMVEVTDKDEIVYAKRLDRDKYSKFVKNKELLPTPKVVIILFEKEYGYLVWSAWCGELIPQETDGKGGIKDSESFKLNHAMVYDPKIIQLETITSENPKI